MVIGTGVAGTVISDKFGNDWETERHADCGAILRKAIKVLIITKINSKLTEMKQYINSK